MSQAPGPYFHLVAADGVSVVRLAGPKLVIDAGVPLIDLVDAGGHRELLLDFAEVRFLSSAALGVLMNLARRVEAAGGRLGLCHLAPELLELLRLTKMDGIFTIHADDRGPPPARR